MLTDVDKKYLGEKGISEEMFEEQLSRFRKGFPYRRNCSYAEKIRLVRPTSTLFRDDPIPRRQRFASPR